MTKYEVKITKRLKATALIPVEAESSWEALNLAGEYLACDGDLSDENYRPCEPDEYEGVGEFDWNLQEAPTFQRRMYEMRNGKRQAIPDPMAKKQDEQHEESIVLSEKKRPRRVVTS
jgi:hypothetical protein